MGDAQGSPSSRRSACRSAGRLGLRGQPTTEERDIRGSQGVIPRHVRPGESASPGTLPERDKRPESTFAEKPSGSSSAPPAMCSKPSTNWPEPLRGPRRDHAQWTRDPAQQPRSHPEPGRQSRCRSRASLRLPRDAQGRDLHQGRPPGRTGVGDAGMPFERCGQPAAPQLTRVIILMGRMDNHGWSSAMRTVACSRCQRGLGPTAEATGASRSIRQRVLTSLRPATMSAAWLFLRRNQYPRRANGLAKRTR